MPLRADDVILHSSLVILRTYIYFISFELSCFDSLNSQGRSQENFGWVGGYLLGGLEVWNNPQMMGTPEFFSKFYLLTLIFMKEEELQY